MARFERNSSRDTAGDRRCGPAVAGALFSLLVLLGGAASAEAVCGDGNLDMGEQCDDGNLDYGDSCTPSCVTVVVSNFTVNTISPVYGVGGNNVSGVMGDAAPGFALGSLASNGVAKTDLYLTPTALFGGPLTLGEIVSIRYWTKKGTTHAMSAPDWYMLIYTDPFVGDVSTPTWYGDRIGTEPYFSASLADPANTWNQFTTDGSSNKLRFFQSTQGAPGASFGSYSDPHWDTFVTGNSLGTASPLAGHSILFFSLQTGSAWAAGFTGQFDGLRIETTGGQVANVNFEFTCTMDSQCDTGVCATDTCNTMDGICSSVFVSAGTECRASSGVCDIAEDCTGSSAACPGDSYEPASTECRPSAGPCDVAEDCDGLGGCPADSFEPSTVVCRADAGQCDIAENCTGASAACPANAFEASSVPCTGSSQGGVCDADSTDHCSGSGNVCVDTYQSSATVCRAVAGVCDVAENCTGAFGACPTDIFLSSSTVCRPDAGECDVPENCTGVAAACPAQGFEPNGTACGDPLDDQCTNPDTCNGAGSCLDNHEPMGTVCDDERICTINDACDGAGECDANAILFKENCTYFATGARSTGSILGHAGNNGAITGDLCFDRAKVFAFMEVTGNVVATADSGGKGLRFGEGATVSGDIVTDGAGVFSIKGAFLPHLTPSVTSLAGGTVLAKDAMPGGTYDLSGNHALVDNCTTARADLLDAAADLDALPATQSYGDTKPASGSTMTLTPTFVGGFNVLHFERLRGGSDVTINVDGGGDPDTVMIVRVGKRFQLRENAVIQMTNGMQSKNFVIYVQRSRTDIGNFSTVEGTIFGRGFVRLGEETILDGQVFGSGGKLELNSGLLGTLVKNEIVLP